MFKKPFRVKSNTRLKGSDTKKLKLEVLKHFPSVSEESISTLMPNKETIFAVKLIVHSGETVILYCVQKLPIMFDIEGQFFPTVYMLWHFPDLLPTFTTHPQVFTAISGGADLMLPGVVFQEEVSIKSYGKLDRGDRVSVNLTCNKAPIAVGKAALSSFDMYMSAKRGKCVNILHYYGDTLSNYGSTLPIPELGPVTFDEQLINHSEETTLLTDNAANLTLDERNDNGLISDECVIESNSTEVIGTDSIEVIGTNTAVIEDNVENSPDKEDLSENLEESINELLMYCFLKSLKTTVKKGTFPLLVSTFYAQHLLAACPSGKNVDIKKSKYKKLSNFLNEVEKTGIIKLEMISKGVQSISFVAYDHDLLKEFDVKYSDFEKLVNITDKELVISNKPAVPEITEKRTVTAAVLPLFSIYLNKKGDSLDIKSVRRCITDYVKSQNLKDKENDKLVKLDKLLKDIVGSKEESLTWDGLINGVVGKMGHAYELIAGETKPTVVKGKLQPIDIQVGTRVGNKKVTLVNNLELYGINVSEFSHECQHGVGASTTINNVPGSKSVQVQIQGNQVIFVNKLLTEKYNIQKRFIRGLENAPKKKKN